jgi:hypothetical protein
MDTSLWAGGARRDRRSRDRRDQCDLVKMGDPRNLLGPVLAWNGLFGPMGGSSSAVMIQARGDLLNDAHDDPSARTSLEKHLRTTGYNHATGHGQQLIPHDL